MKKLLRTLSVSSLAITSLSPLMVVTSCNEPFIVDEEIKAHDAEGWKHAIEHIANCGHPTLFVSNNASFHIQQEMSMFYSSAQLAIKNNHTYLNPGYEFNDQILMVLETSWNAKEYKPGDKPGYFTYDYKTCTDSALGYSDIIANSKSAGEKEIDVTKGNQMVISNLQDFDLSLEKYDKNLNSYISFSNFLARKAYIKIINKILDLYEAKNPNVQFNYVLNWYQFLKIKDTTGFLFQDDEFERLLCRMLRHMDKIYLLSDGSATWDSGSGLGCDLNKFIDYYKGFGYTSAEDQKNILKNIKELPYEKAINYFHYVQPYALLNNEKYVVNFAPCTNASYAKSALDPKSQLTKETTIKYAYPWLVPTTYKNVLGDSTQYQNFLKSYAGLFHSIEDSQYKKFNNYFIENTADNFKSSKGNLIFIMPSAFRESKNPSDALWSECRKIMVETEKSYPVDQWNYIYKFHPGAKTSDVTLTLRKLFDIKEGDPWPENTVILDKVYPFEYLVTYDQFLVDSQIESDYHLIKINSFAKAKPDSVLTGFSLFSTCFFSAITMLENEYGVSKENANKLIQTDAHFLTKKFDMWSFSNPDGRDYTTHNRNRYKSFYKFLYETGDFIDVDEIKFID